MQRVCVFVCVFVYVCGRVPVCLLACVWYDRYVVCLCAYAWCACGVSVCLLAYACFVCVMWCVHLSNSVG